MFKDLAESNWWYCQILRPVQTVAARVLPYRKIVEGRAVGGCRRVAFRTSITVKFERFLRPLEYAATQSSFRCIWCKRRHNTGSRNQLHSGIARTRGGFFEHCECQVTINGAIEVRTVPSMSSLHAHDGTGSNNAERVEIIDLMMMLLDDHYYYHHYFQQYTLMPVHFHDEQTSPLPTLSPGIFAMAVEMLNRRPESSTAPNTIRTVIMER
jgi:hypothetical protein